MSDPRFKGQVIAQRIRSSENRRSSFSDMNPDMKIHEKIGYLRGLAYSKGWRVQEDEKVRMFFHILDENGNDISGAKTVQAAIDFMEDQLSEKEE